MKPRPGSRDSKKPSRNLRWYCLGGALAWLAAGVVQAQLPRGIIVLSNDWAELSGSFKQDFSGWPAPRSFLGSDSGLPGVSGGVWASAGATATNAGIAFQAEARSPFPSPFAGKSSPRAGLVIFGNADGTGRNGPRLNSGIADIQDNPAGVLVQFDTRVSDDYSGVSLLSWYWPNNDRFGLHFGSFSGEQRGQIHVGLPSTMGGGTTNLMPFTANTWYRVAFWTSEAWSSATNYTVSIIAFGGRTNVFAHLSMPDSEEQHGKPFGLEFHAEALGTSSPDTPNGSWAIDNVLVAIGTGVGSSTFRKTQTHAAPAEITPALDNLLADAKRLSGQAPADSPTGLVLKPNEAIVAIGDSITQAGGYMRDADCVLASRYGELKIPKIINAGIGGQKAEDLARRFDADVIARKPAVVTLSIGINDVWHRLANPHDEQVLKDYQANVTRMVKGAQAAGIRVILLAPTVIQEDPLSEGNQRLTKYVEAEKQIAETTGCQFVDLHGMFLEALQQKPRAKAGNWLTADGVHMKPLGDAMMAVGMLRALGVPDAKITGD